MGTKRKSLAEELAELYNPAPTSEYDPEGLDLGDAAQLPSDDELGGARGPTKHAPEKGMLLRGDIELEDAAYRGRKTSRAAIFGGDEDEGTDDLDLQLSGSGEGESDGDEGDEEGEEDEERRAAAVRAGPSGRAAGTRTKLGNGRAAGGGAAGPGSGTRGGADGDADADGLLPSGSEPGSSDLGDFELGGTGSDGDGEDDDDDDADADEEHEGGRIGDDEEEDEEEEEEEEPAARRPAKRQRGGAAGGGGGELDALEAEYEALAAEDEAQVAALRQKGERDRVKGLAVRNQQVLYERALEQRILLQRCLQAANGLPRPHTHAALVRAQPDVRAGYAALASAARETLTHLLDLQRTLMARVPAISLPPAPAPAPTSAAAAQDAGADADADGDGPAANGGGAEPSSSSPASPSPSSDALWGRITGQAGSLAAFRDASLDSWHRRAVLSSGSGALRNSSGLRALNQSVSSQVAALMRDPAKFIKRTRLTLSACPRVLCEPPRATAASADPLGADGLDADAAAAGPRRQGDGPAGDDDGGAAVASSSVAVDVLDEERDPETYDDSEFYSQLLKEFLDKGLASGAAAGPPKASKKRKQVDRRASKGRKLRYHVQDKLVAFMAPVDFEPPPFAANLFSNLFGHAGR